MVRRLGSGLMLVALVALANAQPAAAVPATSAPGGSTATMTPMERAQREADKVFYWVRLHGNAPAKVPPTIPAKDAVGGTPSRSAGTPAPNPNAAAAPSLKRPTPAVRSAEAAAAESASARRTETSPNDDATPETPAASPLAEPPASGQGAVEQGPAKEPTPPASTAPAEPEPTPPADAPSQAAEHATVPATASATPPANPPAAVAAIEPIDTNEDPPQAASVVSPLALARTDPDSRPDDQVERLRPIAQPAPEFPTAVVQSLRRGSVRVHFNVLPDGKVAAVDVVSSSNPRLNPAALAAVAQWRFQPVTRVQPAQVDLAFSID